VLDRVLAIVPGDIGTRAQCSLIELDWRADPKPLHETIATVLAQEPASISELADQWLDVALSERDFASAELALKAMGTSQCIIGDIELPPEWCQGSRRPRERRLRCSSCRFPTGSPGDGEDSSRSTRLCRRPLRAGTS
jgi:hypothetical protein